MKKVFALTLVLSFSNSLAADGHDHAHDAHDHQRHEHQAHGNSRHAHGEHEHDKHESREHGAHEHGVAHLDIVLENEQVLIGLKSPAANIVGFEHYPETDEQKAAVGAAMRTLKSPRLFRFSGSSCQLVDANVETDLLAEDDHGHADFEVEYRFGCSDTNQVTGIDTGLFQQFPGIAHLRVQFIKGISQGASHLTAENPSLRF